MKKVREILRKEENERMKRIERWGIKKEKDREKGK